MQIISKNNNAPLHVYMTFYMKYTLSIIVLSFITTYYIHAYLLKQPIQAEQHQAVEIMPLNEYRRQNGLYELTYNQDLYDSAYARAKNIETGFTDFSHEGYQEHITNYYTEWDMIGENLAKDFELPSQAFIGWIKSPTHNENLLNTNACEYGLAQYKTTYVLHIGCK